LTYLFPLFDCAAASLARLIALLMSVHVYDVYAPCIIAGSTN